jgi:hypothetical protein
LEKEVIEDTREGLANPNWVFGVLVWVWRVDEDGSNVLESRPADRHVFLREFQGWFSRGRRMGPSDGVESSDGSSIRRKAPGSDGSF